MNEIVTIHPMSDVQSKHIGSRTFVWQYCVFMGERNNCTGYADYLKCLFHANK